VVAARTVVDNRNLLDPDVIRCAGFSGSASAGR